MPEPGTFKLLLSFFNSDHSDPKIGKAKISILTRPLRNLVSALLTVGAFDGLLPQTNVSLHGGAVGSGGLRGKHDLPRTMKSSLMSIRVILRTHAGGGRRRF